MTRILFLDQSSQLGGAELCLADIAQHFSQTSLVGVFSEGPFPDYLRQRQIPVKILGGQPLRVKKDSSLLTGIKSLNRLVPLIKTVVQLSKDYDLIYANTQKALVVGAIASLLSRRPLVYHLHDIVSAAHFSAINRRIIITFANQAVLVIANSQASYDAFIQAGGRSDRMLVVYNGFRPEIYANCVQHREAVRNKIAFTTPCSAEDGFPFMVGHFSRFSPWKGQHVLIEALQYCPDNTVALLVGDALFGEEDYVQQLHSQVNALKLERRVKFLGFRSDIPQLMAGCDLVAHTSTAPEPFGRVIVEAMLCGCPVVATAAGGALEIINHGQTGWLTPPDDARQLADVIMSVYRQSEVAKAIALQGQDFVQQRFDQKVINAQIDQLLTSLI